MSSQTKVFQKGEILLRKGEQSKYTYKVMSGCLRSYVVDKAGKLHVLQFAPENWFISDLNSFLNGHPSAVFIDVIETAEVILYDKASEKFTNEVDKEDLIKQRLTLTNHIVALNKRLTMLLSSTAEERYLDFIDTYPALIQRLPLKLIAAYLGITPEYLSEIRKKIIQK
jgi:CRP-like cAMP-binding protein